MLKYILLAGAMTISVPVLAQDKPATADQNAGPTTTVQPSAQTAPTLMQTEQIPASEPLTATEQTPPAQDSTAQDATTSDATVADQAAPADPAAATTAPAQTAAAPVDKAEQVAQVVNTEFPSYDKDANGDLSMAEFGSWMVALKSAADPATSAESAETKTWIGQAFAAADADKNKSVSKTELTGFLSQGA